MQGCGVTQAVLLTRALDEDKAEQEMEKRPGRFARPVSLDPAKPDARVARGSAVVQFSMKLLWTT
jgi:hypothetical protein